MDKDPTPRPLYKSLYFQVITAIVIGVLLGHFYPQTGEAMKPLGDGFIKLIKMIIAPIIFCTVVVGIAGMEDMKKVGKTGGLALLYFEIVSSIALIVGLVDRQRRAARRRHERRPGDARHQERRRLHRARARCRARSTSCSRSSRTPSSTRSPRARSCRCCCSRCCSASRCTVRRPRHAGLRLDREDLARAVLDRRHHHEGRADRRVRRDGVHDRQVRRRLAACQLGKLMGTFYATCLFFIFVVLGLIARAARLLDLEVHQVHQGRAADRARHVVVGVGAAADDGQAGEPRRHEVGGRPGHPDRLLVQPRRHLDLPDDGRGLHRPGDQHAADARRSSSRCSPCCC